MKISKILPVTSKIVFYSFLICAPLALAFAEGGERVGNGIMGGLRSLTGAQAISELNAYRSKDSMTGIDGCKVAFTNIETTLVGSSILGLEIDVTNSQGVSASSSIYIVDAVTSLDDGITYILNGLDQAGAKSLTISGPGDHSSFTLTMLSRAGEVVSCEISK